MKASSSSNYLYVIPPIMQLSAVLNLDLAAQLCVSHRHGTAEHAKPPVALQAPPNHQSIPRLEHIERYSLQHR
jgi:hypothetical protein